MISIKKISTLAAAAALLSFLPAPAHARIGETEAEIEARYGKSESNSKAAEYLQLKRYTRDNMNIYVRFNETTKRSEMERYELMIQPDTAERDARESGLRGEALLLAMMQSNLSPNILDSLMNANVGDETWVVKKFSDGGIDEYWLNDRLGRPEENYRGIERSFIPCIWWRSDDAVCVISYYNKRDNGKLGKDNVKKIMFMTKEFAKANQYERWKAYAEEKKRKELNKY